MDGCNWNSLRNKFEDNMRYSSIRNKWKRAVFKNAIKTKKPSNCPCRLCKQYIAGVGFICPVIYNVGLLHYIHFLMITMGKSMVEERKEREQKIFFSLLFFSCSCYCYCCHSYCKGERWLKLAYLFYGKLVLQTLL